MALFKLKNAYPDYKQDIFGGKEIKDFSVYSEETNDKIGSVYDALVDENGYFRYFVIDTGFWVFGKKVLLPVGRAHLDYGNERLYALGLTKNQVESLPEYNDDMVVDYAYEEQVRSGYRVGQPQTAAYTPDSYNYTNEPELYQTTAKEHGTIKLYEERLIADKHRQKTGDVIVGKTVETETAQVNIPIERERVVIEHRTINNAEQAVSPGEADFREGEVARLEVYEETADIHKEAFVTEEVTVRKEIDRDTVTAQEKLRREKLNLKTEGKPTINESR